MASGYDGTVKIDTSLDTKGFNSGVKGIGSSLEGLVGIIGKVGGALAAAFGVATFVGSLKTASEFFRLKLAAQQVGQMFGWTKEQISGLSDELIKSGIQTDIASKAIINWAREGLDRSMLPALARGAQDLALFAREGETSSDMLDRLMTGILQFDPMMLRTAGIAIDLESTFKTWAAQNGKTAASMTIMDKRAATLAAVVEKLKGVSGLYEISQKTAAGQMQSNTRIMTEFSAAIGMPFQNALYTLIKGFNDLVKSWTVAIQPGGQLYWVMQDLAAVANWLATSIANLFSIFAGFLGITSTKSAAVATSTGQSATNLENAATAAGNLKDNVSGAGSAAKGALASFDQLNVLSQDSGSGGAGSGADAGGVAPIIIPPIDTSPIDDFGNKLDELKSRLLTFFAPAIDAFNRLVIALTPLGMTIWAGLKWAWDNILVPLGTWVITNLLPTFLDLLGAAATVLDTALVILQPLWMWFWTNVLEPAAKWTGQAIIDGLKWLTARLYEFSDWMEKHPDTVRTIATVLLIFAAAWLIVNGAVAIWIGIATLAAAATTAFGVAVAFVTGPIFLAIVIVAALIAVILLLINYWPEISAAAMKAWDWIVGIWIVASSWFQTNVINPIAKFFSQLWEGIKSVWNTVAAWFQQNVIDPLVAFWKPVFNFIAILAHDAWVVIKFLWAVVSAWFQTNVIDPIKTMFVVLWDGIKYVWAVASQWFTTNVIDPIKAIWGVVSQWFTTNVTDPLKAGFTTALDWLLEKWTTIFDGIKGIVKGVVNVIIGLINSMIRGIVVGINAIIGSTNSIGSRVPGWWWIPQVVAPQIPLLATGAVIPPNSRFLAMLGDQRSGTNIEAPESLIRKIVREESGGQDQTITINFAGSLSALMQTLKPYADRESSRIGKSLVKVGVM